MLYATKFQILRRVSPTCRAPCIAQPTAKPVRVAYLLNEEKFLATQGLIAHHDTVFLEDTMHDWHWLDGKFYYYGHAMGLDEVGDIVAIFEIEDCPATKSAPV